MFDLEHVYSQDEIDTIWWVSKRFDYFALACCVVAFFIKYMWPESGIWKLLLIIAIPLVTWSKWATLGASGKIRVWTPWLPALTRWRLKRQGNNDAVP
jgi:hypothetical protein